MPKARFEIVQYRREKFAIALRIKRSRLVSDFHPELIEPHIVAESISRWFQRSLARHWPGTVLGAVHLQVSEHTFFTEGVPAVIGWAWCFKNVDPEDRALLLHHIDRNPSTVFEIPRRIYPE